MTFAKALREKREEKELTQLAVANLLGITWRQYINYERGHIPPYKRLQQLNKIFKYDFSEVLFKKYG